MSQTRKGSLLEAIVNILVGAVVALLSQLVVFPMYGVHVSFNTNLSITAWFTGVSLVRSYWLRRAFNAWKGHA